MNINRTKAATPHMDALAVQIADLHGPCVGCSGCNGLCEALIEALVVPDVILTKKRETQ